MNIIEEIKDAGKLLALIIRDGDYEEGLQFPTGDDLMFQIGLHNQKKGSTSAPHRHHPIPKLENIQFSEVFYLKKGKVKVTLYNDAKEKVQEVVIHQGDLVYLLGGHALEFLEDTMMFEIKQGPYRGKEEDKEMI